ncbi:MAG: NTP transferase domain-containing protein, partial [Pseudomonadota bacterium]
MTVAILIPARYASQRFPGKPLVPLRGATGEERSLIERTWRAAQAVGDAQTIAVATDDERISSACQAFGARVMMTPASCRNGTERCAAALSQLPEDVEIVVNLQGDAPLTPPWFIEALVDCLKRSMDADVATPVLRCDGAMRDSLLADRQAGRVGGTTAVFDRSANALYFSKEVVPF